MDGLKILRGHPKALNDHLLTGKDSLLYKLICPQNNQHFIKNDAKPTFLCSLRMEEMGCNNGVPL